MWVPSLLCYILFQSDWVQSWIYCRLRKNRAVCNIQVWAFVCVLYIVYLCVCVLCIVLCVLCRLRQRAVCYMQRRREAGKQLPVSSNQHYFLPDQRPLFSTTTGQVGKQAEVGGATRKCCFKTQSSSSPPPAAILFPIKKHSFALYQMRWSQIRRWIRADQSECSDLIKHDRGSGRFIKSWFRREEGTQGCSANCITN